MFRFDQLIRRDMIIRDVKQRHPETIPVFEQLHFRAACDDCDIETVARKNGLDVRDVVDALNRGRVRTKGGHRTTCKPLNPSKSELTIQRNQPLDVFFSPKTVAVIGATENPGSVGRTLLWNLVTSPFGGTVYPVNPKRPSVLGVKAYPSVSEIPEEVDLAVIVTPPPSIPGIIRECGENGVRGAIVISAGFKESRARKARRWSSKLLEEAQAANIRVIGPNCLGVMSPLTGMNATFATTIARPGSVGFISQSGALCTAVLDWSLKEMVGFSAFVSVGSMVDVGWGDLIYHLGNDPKTRSIVIYMETHRQRAAASFRRRAKWRSTSRSS